jgi:hypothetical protein
MSADLSKQFRRTDLDVFSKAESRALVGTGRSIDWTVGGAVALATAGTDTACTNGTQYLSELYIPVAKVLTGLGYLIGSVGGTDKVIVALYDSTGALCASSAVAGATVGTAANFQSVAFEATYAAAAGRYFLGLTFNGTTAKFRTYPIPGSAFYAGEVSQTFGTVGATVVPPSTFTANKGPIGFAY